MIRRYEILYKSLFVFLMSVLGVGQICAECSNETFSGEGTYYGGVAGTASGNCGIYVESDDYHHCALNHDQYDESNACGGCIRVTGPKGSTWVKVVDQCPECKPGDIDFSPAAFAEIANPEDGRVPISWYFAPCEGMGGMKFLFDGGMSQYYFKMAVFDHIYPLVSLEYQKQDGSWVEIPKTDYNYYVQMDGIDEDKSKMGPYTFRITATTGENVVVTVPYSTSEVSTEAQFEVVECDKDDIPSIYTNEEFSAPYIIYTVDGMYIGVYDFVPDNLKGIKGIYVVVSKRTNATLKLRLGNR